MKPRTLIMLVVVGLLLGVWLAMSPASLSSLAAPAGTIRYVIPGGSTSGDCTSWGIACELQYALSVAGADDEIWVKAGTSPLFPASLRMPVLPV